MNRCAWTGRSSTTQKPWGHETSWNGLFHGKEIHITAGNRTSLKFNKIKDEILYVQSGEIFIEFADEGHLHSPIKYPARSETLRKGELLNVQAGCPYRLSAVTDAVVFEISDSRFGDERVVIEDDYGRDCSEAKLQNLIFNPAKKA